MPYFPTNKPVRKSSDVRAALQNEGDDILSAFIADNHSRRIMLAVTPHKHAPYVVELTALDAAWLGTQLHELSARADDSADDIAGETK